MIDDLATVRIRGNSTAPPLVILHGYGANERDLLPLAQALSYPGDVVLLRAPLSLAPRAWAWFPLTVIPGGSDLGSDESDVAQATNQVADWLAETYPQRQVVLLGFSQGGAVALQVMRNQPGRVSGVLALSSFVVGATDSPLAANDAQIPPKLPVFFGYGDADTVIPPALTSGVRAWLRDHVSLTERCYPGLPHAVAMPEIGDIRDFLSHLTSGDARIDPTPTEKE